MGQPCESGAIGTADLSPATASWCQTRLGSRDRSVTGPSRAGRTLVTLTEDAAKTYEAAGVSLATADAVVERLRSAVESTGATGFWHLAGLFPLDEGRLLAASTDTVGSKLLPRR